MKKRLAALTLILAVMLPSIYVQANNPRPPEFQQGNYTGSEYPGTGPTYDPVDPHAKNLANQNPRLNRHIEPVRYPSQVNRRHADDWVGLLGLGGLLGLLGRRNKNRD